MKTMSITKQEQQKAEAFLQSHGVKMQCPACGGTDLFFAEILTLPFRERGQSSEPGIHTVPNVCRKCGHARLFVAGLLGLIPERGR